MTLLAAMSFRPVMPWPIILLLVIAGLAAAWRTYAHCPLPPSQRRFLWCLRAPALLVLAWLLLQAERRTVSTRTEAPVLALAVDVSASMTDSVAAEHPTRADRALELLRRRATVVNLRRYRLQRFDIGAEVEERTETPGAAPFTFNAPRSDIVAGLNRIADRLQAENVAGILLLTDGLDHSAAALSAPALGMPIIIPELEDPGIEPAAPVADCWIAEVTAPERLVAKWRGSVDVTLRRTGGSAQKVPVQLSEGGRPLRTAEVDFGDGDRFARVTFSIEPEATGQVLYRIAIDPRPDGDPANNTREFVVDVTDQQNRVLYLEGVPRWEFKFIKRALLEEKGYDIAAFVQGPTGVFVQFSETGDEPPAVPEITRDGLRSYRVVILGELDGQAFNPEQCTALAAFIERGGGLLVVGGSRTYGPAGLGTAAELQAVLPMAAVDGARMGEGRFAVDLTVAGRSHPALAGLPPETVFPPILSVWSPVRITPAGAALMATADGTPVLAVRRYGQGRVAVVLTDSLWRWQLGAQTEPGAKNLYSQVVTQLVHWLAPSERDLETGAGLQMFLGTNEADVRERVHIGAVFQGGDDDELICRITTPDGQRLQFPMPAAVLAQDVGLSRETAGFGCVFTPREPGKYGVVVATKDGAREATGILIARRSERERTGEPMNRALLLRLADETGGRFVPWAETDTLFDAVPYAPRTVERRSESALWDRWWWLAILLLLFCTEWYWRRRLDLV